jgi:hypothetical protein
VQFLSLTLMLGVVILIALVIGLAILASPIFAVGVFIVAFGAFLVWRGARRSEATRGLGETTGVPSTEEASADPARDSGLGDVKPERRP